MADFQALDKDIRLQLEHVQDLLKRVQRLQEPLYSRFMDPAAQRRIQTMLHSGDCRMRWFGGFDDAERRILACFPGWMEEDALEFPMAVLIISWDARFDRVGHRDLLGAILGLGLEREGIGDILVGERSAQVFVINGLVDYIRANLTQVGRASVQVALGSLQDVMSTEVDADMLRMTVPSLRLDAILAAVFHLSRAKAAQYIAAGQVQVNWLPDEKNDRIMKLNDRIVLRGQGRACILNVGEPTRKGRIPIEVEKTRR